MIKTQKMSVFGEIYTTGKKVYTAGGNDGSSDGSDKSHLCVNKKMNFWSQVSTKDSMGCFLVGHVP